MRKALNRAMDAPHLPVAFYLAYAAATTLRHGPSPVLSNLPAWLTYLWSGALLVSAALVFFGTLREHNRAESAGHGFALAGLGLYALTAYLALGFSGSLVVVLLSLGGVSGIRLRILSRSRTARGLAAQIVAQGGDGK